MQKIILNFLLLFTFFLHSFTGSSQAINTQDSLALVDLYNSTNGSGWINHANWLTTAPLSTWYGISITSGRVTTVSLSSNKLTGSLPSSLGNLTAVNLLYLDRNQISGTIPTSLSNLTQLWALYLNDNQLSGKIPATLNSLPGFVTIQIKNNRFTFDGMEGFATKFRSGYSPQADIPLLQNGSKLFVSTGGTLANKYLQMVQRQYPCCNKNG